MSNQTSHHLKHQPELYYSKVNRKHANQLNPPVKRMLDINELGVYMGLSPQTIRNKFYAGDFPIPAKKIFSKLLWDVRDVDRFLDNIIPSK